MDFISILGQYEELISERSDYEKEWQDISEFLLPGRGIYQTYNKPRKRKLTSPKAINTSSREAMGVLTAELHSRLTSPARPWFILEWDDPKLEDVQQLSWWMKDSQERLYNEFAESNFYSSVLAFYDDLVGFGTSSMYVGEGDGDVAFRFEPLTVGEYAVAINAKGVVDLIYRTIFMTPRNMVEKYGEEKVSSVVKDIVKKNEPQKDVEYVTVLECIKNEPVDDKPFKQIHFEYGFSGATNTLRKYDNISLLNRKPLLVRGFYEFPYPTSRWSTVGADVYGLGPGSKALPDIKRLQEMEKAFLMTVHKSADPPILAPTKFKGRLNTLPGGKNYYSTPTDSEVRSLYEMRFDYQGVAVAIERVEERIRKAFYNDLFFTANRDPNATPYKATEVNAREREKMTRLGPVVERLQHEFFIPIIQRCFNMMVRQGKFAELPPELSDMIGGYNIRMVSSLAQAQRLIALDGMQQFLMMAGQIAQFDQKVIDKINTDGIVDEMAEITGQAKTVLNTDAMVKEIRDMRMKQQAQERQMQMQMMQQQMQLETAEKQTSIAKDRADIAKTIAEVQGNA